MNILRAPQAPVLARIPYGNVEWGFMRSNWGEIFFLTQHGRETVSFPVLEDGSISTHGDLGTWPETVVELIHPKNLGITKIKWETRPPG